MKYSTAFPLLVLLFSLSSCNVFLKSQLNKKYPPLPLNAVRDSALRRGLTLPETSIQDVGISIQDSIINTVVTNVIKSEIDKDPTLGISQIDSIHIYEHNIQSTKQSSVINSFSKLHFDPQKTYGIKSIELNIDGLLFPNFHDQAIYLNPAFSRIHIERIKFKNIFYRLFSRPAKAIVNNIFKLGLENLNGLTKNVKVDVEDSLAKSVAISSLLTNSEGVSVIKDDTIKAKVNFSNIYFLIDSGRIAVIGNISYGNRPDNAIRPTPRYWLHPDVIESMNDQYNFLFHTVWWNSFDSVDNHDNLTVVNHNTIFSILNSSINSLNTELSYKLDENEDIPKEQLKLFEKTADCNLINRLTNCAGWVYDRCSVEVCVFGICAKIPYPPCLAFLGPLCAADLAKALVDCNSYTRTLRDLITNLGTIEGNVHLGGELNLQISNVSITSTNITIPTVVKSSGANADLKFSFIQNGLAGFLLCNLPILNKNLHFDLSVDELIPLTASHELKIIGDSSLSLLVKSEESYADIRYGPSIPELLLQNPFDLTMNCNMAFTILGISIPIVAATSLIACKIKPDGSECHFTKVFLDGVFKQLYTLKINSKEKSLNIFPPVYKLEPYTISYKYRLTNKYFEIKHLFKPRN